MTPVNFIHCHVTRVVFESTASGFRLIMGITQVISVHVVGILKD